MREHAVDHRDQVIGLDRLLEIVGRAVAQRLDRAVDRGVRGEQHERHARRDPARAVEQREPGHAAHLEIGEHEVGRGALERGDRRLGALDALERKAVPERVAHLLSREPAVVDTQDAFSGIRLCHRAGSEFSHAIRSRGRIGNSSWQLESCGSLPVYEPLGKHPRRLPPRVRVLPLGDARDVQLRARRGGPLGRRPHPPCPVLARRHRIAERRLTYADVSQHARRAAHLFRGLGIEAGQPVIVMLPRVPEWQAVIVGLLEIGALVVPSSTQLRPKDVLYRASHSGAVAIVASHECVDAVEAVRGELPGCEALPRVRARRDPRRPGWTDLGMRSRASPTTRRRAGRRSRAIPRSSTTPRAPRARPRRCCTTTATPGRSATRRASGTACARANGSGPRATPAGRRPPTA